MSSGYAEAATSDVDAPRLLPVALAGMLLALLVLTTAPARERSATTTRASASALSAVPLEARPLVSWTLGKDQAPYAVRTSARGLVASNAAQGLSARFGQGRVRVRAGSDTLALRLRSVGYGEALKPVAAATANGQANRVSYRRGSLTEWYANGPLGLEQGFTLKAPPSVARTGPLYLALSLSGSLQPRLGRDARSLSFAGSNLRYTGLTAFDARGRRLPARLALRGQTLLIRVADTGARYPLTIDPFFQLAKLTASDGVAGDDLGVSVGVSGDTLAVGAPFTDGADAGAVYVFVKPPSGWTNGTQTAKLTASDAQQGDILGTSVAISGDTIVAGARAAAVSGHSEQGAVYVFVKPPSGWANATETAKLTALDGAAKDWMGQSVAVSGDTIVAGAPGPPWINETRPGAVYVFVKPPSGWTNGTQTAKLMASDGQELDFLGASVAISGDTIVAGARQERYFAAGAAYVFVKPAGGWANGTQTAKLIASDGQQLDFLGASVAISGDTIVAGAPAPYKMTSPAKGAAYVFVKPAGGWTSGTQTAKLTASDGVAGDALGSSVAVSGDTIVAGAPAPGAMTNGHPGPGAAYVFVKPSAGWASGKQTAKLTASDGVAGDAMGSSVAFSADTIVAGAPAADVSGHDDQGAAYVFVRPAAATIAVTKQLSPASDPGLFDLRIGQTVVKAAAGNGGTGSLDVPPGTYRVTESAVAGTSLSNYSTSIACTLNGHPGPSSSGSRVDVTVAEHDQVACTITNKRKAQITLTKHLIPAGDPGRFDLKVGGTVVKAAAGDGNSGSLQVVAGTYTLSEVPAVGTSLARYASSIACTRNGAPGPSGTGTSLKVILGWADVLACTITNQPGATIALANNLAPSSDPGRFDLKVAGTVVKASAGNGGSGSLGVLPGTYRVAESASAGTSLSDYATAIACTLNGNPGPSAQGTTQLDVTVAVGDQVAYTFTNRRKAQVTLTKHLVPTSDPGRFDLKLTSSTLVRVVRTGAGEGDSGTIQVAPGTWTVGENPVTGTSLSDYASSIACTRNGGPGPSGNGPSLQVTLAAADVLVCTITNQRK